MSEESFSLTRYLYSFIEVRQSLMMALLDRQRDEALFWLYELYFSEKKRDAFEYVIKLYNYLYKQHNPELEAFINKLFSEWEDDPELDHHIGTIVSILCGRDYCVSLFINEVIHAKALPGSIEKPRKKLKMALKSEDVDKYRTILADPGKAYTVPRKVCLYTTRKNVTDLFSTFVPENIKEVYSGSWEYYANRMYVWRLRMDDWSASFDDETCEIQFEEKDTDSDDNHQGFYERWGYEPDEQPVSVQEKWMGTGKEVQMTLKEFGEKYGAIIPIKVLKIKPLKRVVTQPLSNEIAYT